MISSVVKACDKVDVSGQSDSGSRCCFCMCFACLRSFLTEPLRRIKADVRLHFMLPLAVGVCCELLLLPFVVGSMLVWYGMVFIHSTAAYIIHSTDNT